MPALHASTAALMLLYGSVSDPSGLPVAGARVRLACGGAAEVQTTTNAGGQFTLPESVRCRVSIAHHGFLPYEAAHIHEPPRITLQLAAVNHSVNVNGAAPGPLTPSFLGWTIQHRDLARVSNDSAVLLRFATTAAGATNPNRQVVVDGMPGTLPPAHLIESLSINSDPFSAEFATADQAQIHIVTRPPARKFRPHFGGASLGLGGRNTLDNRLRPRARSARGGLSGPIPMLPWAFSAQGSFARNEEPLALRAAGYTGPPAPAFQRNVSGTLDLYYTGGEATRAHATWRAHRSSATNVGAGGIVLPEAAYASQSGSDELRGTFSRATAGGVTMRGGLWVSDARGDLRANSEAAGVSVPGEFVRGGAPFARLATRRTSSMAKAVAESPVWSAGLVLQTAYHGEVNTPNPHGLLQLAAAEATTGAWFFSRGNPRAQYNSAITSPFAQAALLRRGTFAVNAGLRGEHQTGGAGWRPSPRLSVLWAPRGFAIRSGAAYFTGTLPNEVFLAARRSSPGQQQQYIALGGEPEQSLSVVLSPRLTRSRQAMWKTSIERRLGRWSPGVEWTVTHTAKLYGVRRVLAGAAGLRDIVEPDRRAHARRLNAHLGYGFGLQSLVASYQWAAGWDNGAGLNSHPARQDDVAAEWARTAGLARHELTLAAMLQLPRALSMSITESWRSASPYNITTGLDAEGNGLLTGRGGLPRNSADGPGYQCLSLYASRPFHFRPPGLRRRSGLAVTVGVQGENLLNRRNFAEFGAVTGSSNFGAPMVGSPGRSIKVWLGFNP